VSQFLELRRLELNIYREADYRSRIRRWGAADASWKKNGNSDASEAIATTLLRYAQSGHEIELYRWGELLPEREVFRIKNQSHVPFHKLFNASRMDSSALPFAVT